MDDYDPFVTDPNSENGVLVELAKTYDIRSIRNIHKLAEVWDSITEEFNQRTGLELSKKQLQKRLANMSYSQRKKMNVPYYSGRSKPLDLDTLAAMNTAENDQVLDAKQEGERLDDSEDSNYQMENAILIDLAKRNNVRNVKNFHKLAEIWEEVTSSFNTSTGRNYTKKQLQKRLSNLGQQQRRKKERLIAMGADPETVGYEETEPSSNYNYNDDSNYDDDYDWQPDHHDETPQPEVVYSTTAAVRSLTKSSATKRAIVSTTSTSSTVQDDYEQAKVRAEVAKESAELKRAKVEEVRLKKEQVLVKAAIAKIAEAERRAEIAQLELKAKQKELFEQF